MTHVLACGDVLPGCSAVLEGETESVLLSRVADHAAAAHGLTDIDEGVLAAVRAAIRQA